jgi:subtilisin family serine protease
MMDLVFLNEKEGELMRTLRILVGLILSGFVIPPTALAQGADDIVYIEGKPAHPSHILVRTRGGLSSHDIVEASELIDTTVLMELEYAGVTVLELPAPGEDEILAAIAELEATGLVEYAEPDFQVSLVGLPNDPHLGSLWGMHNTGQTGGTPDADIDAPEAWDVVTASPGVAVVIDTGVDYSHVDLAANMWVNPGEISGNNIDDDGNGYVDDVHGINAITGIGNPMDDHYHGTHVAGTIGARGNNGIGVAGVTWGTQIMACKFLDSGGYGFTSDAVECLEYVSMMKATYGVDIRLSNNSWGGGAYSQALYDAIQDNGDKGILFIASAGNSALDTDIFPHYPSSYDHPTLISVAATNHNDLLWSWSNYGLESVDLGAPGSSIFSTMPGGQYGTLSGTSMASPHVSGAAMLTWAQHPAYNLMQIKQTLLTTVDPLASLAGKTVSGGRLNVHRSAVCVPGNWQLSISLEDGFQVFQGREIVLTAQLASCTLALGADVSASFSNGDADVALRDDGNAPDETANDGVYSGAWVAGALGDVTVTVEAEFENDTYSATADGTILEAGGLVGYYDMIGQGKASQEPPILTAGGTPVLLEDLTPADLAGLDVLFVQNASNYSFGTEYLSRLSSIQSAVENGMNLIIHDRRVDDAETILPGGANFEIIRDFYDDRNIDILDDTTLVTNGPGGVLNDDSLDGGSSSSHGFSVAGSLPEDAAMILSRTDPEEIVTMCYEFGAGSVTYSTIPLDFYLAGNGYDPVRSNMAQVYAPNVVAYGAAGACNAGPCIPDEWRVTTTLDDGFTAYEDRELVITARLEDCELARGAVMSASFSNGDPTLALLDDGVAPDAVADDGIYSGAWLPHGIGALTVTIDARFEGQDYTLDVAGTVHGLPDFTLGMAADNGGEVVVVFDAIADTALASIDVPSVRSMGDCVITSDQTLGFVTTFDHEVWVIDLPTMTLADGINPIAISNYGEDLSFSPDEKYLVACDGAASEPVSVIDIATRSEVTSFPMSRGCNAVDVCSDGSVLVTSYSERQVRRLLIGEDGSLTDSGDVLPLAGTPHNVFCGAGGASGVVVMGSLGELRSFTIPGLALADTQDQTGFGISGLVNADGNRLYARDNSAHVEAFEYDSVSGQIGASLFRKAISSARTFYGMDQMALHPGAPKLYVSQPTGVEVFDAENGTQLTTITHADFYEPTGVCFGNVGAAHPPQEVCGEIEEEDFGPYEAYECAAKQGAGTVTVFNQEELDAYLVDFGFDGDKVKNLRVSFNPTGEVEIRSPCHVAVSGENNLLDIGADSVRVFGREGVTVAEDYANPDRGITSQGALTLVSTEGDAGFFKGLELSAQNICVQAHGTAKIGEQNVVEADVVELISTGDLSSSHAQIRQGSHVTADRLRLEASREASIGHQVTVDAGQVTLSSTGTGTSSVAIIEQAANVTADSLSLVSMNKATVGMDTVVTVQGMFEMEAEQESKCLVRDSATITSGAISGNCSAFLPEPVASLPENSFPGEHERELEEVLAPPGFVASPFADEFVTTGSESGEEHYVPSNGDGTFAAMTSIPGLGSVDGTDVADMDGDEDNDFLICDGSVGGVFLYTNNGAGSFTPTLVASSITNSGYCTNLRIADFDRDGLADFVVGDNRNIEGTKVYLQGPIGTFIVSATLDTAWAGGGNTLFGAAAGDIDSDGNLDVLLLGYQGNGPGEVRFYAGDGSGGFAGSTTLFDVGDDFGAQSTVGLGTFDAEGDGDLDIVAGGGGGGSGYVYTNDGAGNFTPPAGSSFSLGSYLGIDAYDADGDDDHDLVVAVYGARKLYYVENLGDALAAPVLVGSLNGSSIGVGAPAIDTAAVVTECGAIEEEDFGPYEAYECAAKQGAGTVTVFNQEELGAYLVDFGFDGEKAKNLKVAYNPTGDIDIRSPCHVALAGLDNYLDITASSLRVFGRTGVAVAEDYANPDRGITSEGEITLVSTQGDANFFKGLELSASRICVQAEGTARIGEVNVVQAEVVELVSTGDRTDSHAQLAMASQVSADLLRLEASRETTIGEQTTIDVGELILHSTGAFTLSVAYIKQAATVVADSISMISGNKATVQSNTEVHVTGEFEMEAESEAKCTVHDSAVISYGARSGNCSLGFPPPNEPANPHPPPVPSATLGVRIAMALLLLMMGSHMIRSRSGRDRGASSEGFDGIP